MADKNVYNSSYTGKQVDDAVSRLINVTAPVLTEDNIVQATGDSSSNIMSQKAVTDALTRNIPTKVSQLENDSGYITGTELEGKDYATNTKVNNLQTQVTQNKDNLNSEITNRESADSQLQNNIDNETSERNTADTNLQTQITNNDTDISNLQSTKLDSSKADKNVVSGVTVSANDDNVNVVRAYVNLSTQATSSDAETFPLANDTAAGLMSKADYSQIRDNKARIEQLEGQNVRLTYTASTSPTASQIEAFVKAEGYTDTSKWIYIGVVVSGTNHIWRYYSNTATWTDIGVDTVNQFTNSIAGIIKGSATAGKVYAETDGTGSVYGWDNLNTSVSNNTSAISTETTNRQSADNTLQTNIDTLDGQVVKLGIDQTIPSIKTFSNYIKTPQVASVEGKGLVRYKETEGKSVYGNDSTGNVLMGNTDRPSYSKSGSDFTGTDLALYNDVTTETNARTSADTTLQSNIDSEASTREASDTNLQSQISTNATNIANKVDKVTGKGLSTNDFTTAYKNQIDTNTSNIANKLEASNIKPGTNITVSTSGNDVTISAETGEGGTNVYVNNVKQNSVSFTSDPQTQINSKQDSLTTAQQNAVNSGITSSLVTQINTNKTNIETNTDNISVKANLSANNLSDTNIESWQKKLITSAIAGKGISISNGVINGMSMTTLWTNPSPSSGFSEQTITLSSSDWDFLIIVSSMYYGYEAGHYGTITFDGTASLLWGSASTSSYFTWETWARKVTAESKTSLKIADNIYVRNGNSSIQNAHNQPLKIIGVKVA